MTSEPGAAYVWAWLPGRVEPVVAGVLEPLGQVVTFTYARSYLARPDAIAPYLPELPLMSGRHRPGDGLRLAGCIADAGPDAWGRRVILRRLFGSSSREIDPGDLDPLRYLLESGSNRIGALDFQASPTDYVARSGGGTLAELQRAADRLLAGEPFSPELDGALLHGSSVGGARPKALVSDGARQLIAKFSSSTDPYPVVKAEGAAMLLAARVGIDVAAVEVVESLGRDVLLVERFDRTAVPGERRMMVSALTIAGLDEMFGRYATYHELADTIRERFADPTPTLQELFDRIAFNICVGNTDDHARNHAAFWDGRHLRLTPAFDICPQLRSGGEAAQAMAIGRDGARSSRLAVCVEACDVFHLSRVDATQRIAAIVDGIHASWSEVAELARLTRADREQLWGRQILNPFAFEGFRS